jgi:hypothetical protein
MNLESRFFLSNGKSLIKKNYAIKYMFVSYKYLDLLLVLSSADKRTDISGLGGEFVKKKEGKKFKSSCKYPGSGKNERN